MIETARVGVKEVPIAIRPVTVQVQDRYTGKRQKFSGGIGSVVRLITPDHRNQQTSIRFNDGTSITFPTRTVITRSYGSY